jgi:hypothetical protein
LHPVTKFSKTTKNYTLFIVAYQFRPLVGVQRARMPQVS